MNGPIRRMAVSLFVGFWMLLGAVTWFQVIGADRYRSDPRNPRTLLSLAGKERGLIVSADGTVLAQSTAIPDDPLAFTRQYPAGDAFTPVVGHTSVLVGSSGLEDAYADRLRSRRDATISDMIAALFGRDLRPLNLQLTIDHATQQAAYNALDRMPGAVVALDPGTGEVLAYVSSPSYDASLLTGPEAVAARQTLLDDPREPLRDRAGQELEPPGSTFKTIVAAAALESGSASPESEFADVDLFPLPGSEAAISNFGGGSCAGGSTVTLQTAFVRSCNTVFAELAIRTGAGEIGDVATAVGFNRQLEFEWPLAESVFPSRELADDPAALGQSGIGERDVRATPLAMAMVAAAIANQGEVMQPQLVSRLFDADGATIEDFPPERLGRAMSPAVATVLSQMMERAVTEGTGRRAAVAGVRVAGKTGTASGVGGSTLWFIGLAPVEDPTIAVAVMVGAGADVGEQATGGSVAAPIAAEVIEAWLRG